MKPHRRRRAAEPIHDYQHALIADDLAEHEATPRRETTRRRETGKRAWWTLKGHLILAAPNGHGHRQSFVGLTYADLAALHARLHAEAAA